MLSAISLANDAVSASFVVSEKAWEAVDFTSMTSSLNLVCLAAGIFSGEGDKCQVTFCDKLGIPVHPFNHHHAPCNVHHSRLH